MGAGGHGVSNQGSKCVTIGEGHRVHHPAGGVIPDGVLRLCAFAYGHILEHGALIPDFDVYVSPIGPTEESPPHPGGQ